MEYILTSTPIPGMLLWAALYISDYYMTLAAARGYKDIGVFKFEKSFELTPQFQKDIDGQSRISRRHILYLFAYTIIIPVFWFLGVRILRMDWLYSFLIGALLLLEVAVHMRHFRNWKQIHIYKREGGVTGSIIFGQRFSYLSSAFDLYLYAVLFLLVFLVTFSPFFLGGTFSCYLTGLKHSRLAQKLSPPQKDQLANSDADPLSR